MTFNKDRLDVDFVMIYRKANEILATTSVIEVFPYKISQLIKEQSDIRLCKYSKALSKYGIPMEHFGSESAVLMECEGAYIIFYNDEEKEYRVRFSIGHEFGHYVFKHKMNLRDENPLYQKQEIEANCFAAQLLMPEQIIREAVHRGKTSNIDYLMKSFDVSKDAAEKRRDSLAKYEYEWRKREEKEFDDIILMRYAKFIDKIAPKNNSYDYDYAYEDEIQKERDSWLDPRSRWS